MKKRIILCLFSTILFGIFFSHPVYADMGPKPSVNITFSGINDQQYYVTLLSKESSTGPFSYQKDPQMPSDSSLGEDKQMGLKAWQAFCSYQDADGFYFLNYFARCDSDNTFRWGYYPPGTFKVLIYFPQQDTFQETEILERYAFDSYYQVTYSDQATVILTAKTYDYVKEVVSFLIRLVLTLAIELGIACLFYRRKKKVLIFILIMNVITQVLLNVMLSIINYRNGSMLYIFWYGALEILICIIEASACAFYFKKYCREYKICVWTAPVYAIVSNTASFAAGVMLSVCLPTFF